ncbi:MAG: hypothetical protein RBR23_06665 [Arcobacteraceae bacterium]|jgi:hypothetical protein|nr:hypothetical protein [Arcobacteraceae bacterium]
MKKLVLSAVLVANLFAVDYSSMTIDELRSLRGSVGTEEQEAFRSAMQSKMQTLTPEERSAYRDSQVAANGTQQRLKDGSGSGGMYKGSKGQGKK